MAKYQNMYFLFKPCSLSAYSRMINSLVNIVASIVSQLNTLNINWNQHFMIRMVKSFHLKSPAEI